MNAISMRQLQKMSARAIRALPHAVPIKSGTATVGVLMPVTVPTPERLREVLAQIDDTTKSRTPEEQAAVNALLAERGID